MLTGFSKMLKARRQELNMSQKQVAEAMGLEDTGNISNYERGKATPPIDLLPEIAKALDSSVGYFFGEISEKGSEEERELLQTFRTLDKEMQIKAVKIIKCLSA